MAGEHHGTRPVGHLLHDVEQAEQLVHVHQALTDLAIDEAEKIQRLVKLHKVGVHQHEFPHRHLAGQHAARRHQHDHAEADRDDDLLAQVQHVQRHLAAHRGALVAGQCMVETVCLVALVAEIFDRLEVQQAVDGA